jgi:transcriptional regulator with GAF, ATPase, and Fis domain
VLLSRAGASAFDALKGLLLEIAQEQDLEVLLSLIVRRLAESSPEVALARIWLADAGDACGDCRNARVCSDRRRCLHLVASAHRPRGGELVVDCRPDSAFRRIPIGAFKVGQVFAQRGPLIVADARTDAHIARPAWVESEHIAAFGGQPLIARDDVLGVLGVFVRVPLTPAAIDLLRVLANHAAAAIASARAFDQVARLRERLEQENAYLRGVVRSLDDTPIVGTSPLIRQIHEQIALVAPTDTTVLISGESGTGKELVAEEIHRRSRRAAGAFVPVNCAAIPRELYESEFFGHARGAFSGAIQKRVGRFEAAEGGTLFLDEVGEIPLDLQSKLLRVLQESQFERVGETQSRRANVRIVAATNRDLDVEVDAGRFREDLYYRLNVFPIETPPLRAHREDIALIAARLVHHLCRRMHRAPLALAPAELAILEAHGWPGNVRELQNVLERAVVYTPTAATHLCLPPLPQRASRPSANLPGRAAAGHPDPPAPVLTDSELRRLQRDNLVAALRAASGRVSGPGGAAELLGIKPSTLASRLRKLGIHPVGSGER